MSLQDLTPWLLTWLLMRPGLPINLSLTPLTHGLFWWWRRRRHCGLKTLGLFLYAFLYSVFDDGSSQAFIYRLLFH